MDVAFSLSDDHRHYPAVDEQVASAGGDRAVGAARFWAIQNEKMEAFRREHADASFCLRYEQLTTAPEATLAPLFRFLGEPWDATVLDYDRRPHHAGWEDPDVRRRSRIEPNSGNYRRWPGAVQDAVRRACEPVLTRLGYE
jgi:hypothetical protein